MLIARAGRRGSEVDQDHTVWTLNPPRFTRYHFQHCDWESIKFYTEYLVERCACPPYIIRFDRLSVPRVTNADDETSTCR
jgi:hypothetical protein